MWLVKFESDSMKAIKTTYKRKINLGMKMSYNGIE